MNMYTIQVSCPPRLILTFDQFEIVPESECMTQIEGHNGVAITVRDEMHPLYSNL